MGLLSATSIGVGAMIGAGIFALLGIAVELAGAWAFVSFLLAGGIVLLTTYSVSRLAVTYPSKGGRTEFLNRAYGAGVFSGSLNILMWMGYLIVTSLYARAFGEYGVALFGLPQDGAWLNLLASGIVVLFLAVNFLGATLVGRSELLMVVFKVGVLVVFSILGLSVADASEIRIEKTVPFSSVLLAAGVIFMSYEGFGLVANTAEDIRDPERNLPRALFISVVLVMLVYVLVTFAVIGNLSMDQILESKEYVLAEAARPVLGAWGFTLMGAAALISSASAINATIYGPVHMVQETAKARQLPAFFSKALFGHDSGRALLASGLVILVAANFLSLQSIAETGSLIFLIVYTAVNIGNVRLHRDTNSNKYVSLAAAAGTGAVFCALLYYEIRADSLSTYLLAALVAACFCYEWLYRHHFRGQPG